MKFKGFVCLVVLVSLVGCVHVPDITKGDPALLAKGASMQVGTVYSERIPLPAAKKYPIKISNWSVLQKDLRSKLKPYFHTGGNYVSAVIQLDYPASSLLSANDKTYLYFQQEAISSFSFMIADPKGSKDIVEDWSVKGVSTMTSKQLIMGGSQGASWMKPNGDIAAQNAVAELLMLVDQNKIKIDGYYRELQ